MPRFNQRLDVIKHPKLGPGEWLVAEVGMGGGGTGHGPGDIYPDGHQLTLYRLRGGQVCWGVEPKRFFQSGSFSDDVMLPFVPPLHKMK